MEYNYEQQDLEAKERANTYVTKILINKLNEFRMSHLLDSENIELHKELKQKIKEANSETDSHQKEKLWKDITDNKDYQNLMKRIGFTLYVIKDINKLIDILKEDNAKIKKEGQI